MCAKLGVSPVPMELWSCGGGTNERSKDRDAYVLKMGISAGSR